MQWRCIHYIDVIRVFLAWSNPGRSAIVNFFGARETIVPPNNMRISVRPRSNSSARDSIARGPAPTGHVRTTLLNKFHGYTHFVPPLA